MAREEILKELRGLAEDFTLTPFVKQRVADLHLRVFGRVFAPTTCRNCYHDAIMLMYHHLKKNLPMAKEREFILKRGVLIQPTFGVAKFYTALTITDDVAREYLKAHPEDKKLFEKVGSLDVEPQETPSEGEKPAEGVVVPQEENKPSERKQRGKNRYRR